MRLTHHTTFPPSSRERGGIPPPAPRWRCVATDRPLPCCVDDYYTEHHRHPLAEMTS